MRGLRSKLNLLEDSDFGIVDKKEINIMADVKNTQRRRPSKKPNAVRKSKQAPKLDASEIIDGLIEYKMPKETAEIIIKDDKTKRTPQEILCEFVNTQYCLKGYCVRVLLY